MSTEYLTSSEKPLLVKEIVEVRPGISIAFGAPDRVVSNEELLRWFAPNHDGSLVESVEASGFTYRHHPAEYGTFFKDPDATTQKMIGLGTELGKAAMKKNNWDGADHLIVATSAIPQKGTEKSQEWVKQMARNLGIPENTSKLYCLACAGAGVAFQDTLRNPDLKDSRLVIVGMELLGDLVNPNVLSDPIPKLDPIIFGSGGSALAFYPRRFEYRYGEIKIVKDTRGVIRSPWTFNAPIEDHKEPLEGWDVEEAAKPDFAYTDYGAFHNLPVVKGDPPILMEMDRKAAGVHFITNAALVANSVLQGYLQRFPDEQAITTIVSHQASLPVITGISNYFVKRLGISEKRIPWVMNMKKVGMGNVSAGTSFIPLAILGREIKDPFLFLSFGAGSTFSAVVIKFRE